MEGLIFLLQAMAITKYTITWLATQFAGSTGVRCSRFDKTDGSGGDKLNSQSVRRFRSLRFVFNEQRRQTSSNAIPHAAHGSIGDAQVVRDFLLPVTLHT